MIYIAAMPPSPDWVLWDAYRFYYDASGATGNWSDSWTEMGKDRIGMLHNFLSTGTSYKYKVSVLDEDGNETTGTVADNGGAGYNPSEPDQSNLTGNTISAQYMIAEYAMYAQEFIGGAFRTEDWGDATGAKIDLYNETIKFGGSGNPSFSYDSGVLRISGGTIIASVLQSSDWGENTGSKIDLDADTIYFGGSGNPVLSYDSGVLQISGGTIIASTLQSSDWGDATGSKIDLANDSIKFGGSGNPVFSYDSGVLQISGGTIVASVLQSNDWSTGAGTQLSLASGTFTMGGASSPGFYATSGGVVQIGPNGTYLDFDPTIPQMVLAATFKTSSSGKRIEIPGTSGADVDELYAYDAANKKRATIRDTGIEVWNANGAGATNRLAYLSSVAASGAWLKHDEVYVTQDLVVGSETDPGGSWDAWVSGPARLGGGSVVTGTLRVGDHDPTGATGYVVNVVFGTGAAPTASNYPEGTLFIKYA